MCERLIVIDLEEICSQKTIFPRSQTETPKPPVVESKALQAVQKKSLLFGICCGTGENAKIPQQGIGNRLGLSIALVVLGAMVVILLLFCLPIHLAVLWPIMEHQHQQQQ